MEPIGLATFLSLIVYEVSLSAGVYRIVCDNTYGTDVSVNCSDLIGDAETNVQQQSTRWTMYTTLAYLVPAILVDTYLG